MQYGFDYYNIAETPSFTLCNPNKTQLFSLDMAFDRKISLKYNAISDLEFSVPQTINEVEIEAWDYIKSKRLVLVEGIGYFVIVTVGEDYDGAVPIKRVECKSYEYDLATKRLAVFNGTVQFYNILTPENTLMGRILELIPNWTLGTIDSELMIKYRTFDIDDTTIYNFLVKDVAEAYQCVFIFDTINMTISAKLVENIDESTEVYLTFTNTLKDGSFEEISDEICTCLYCYGAGNLDIRTVNPLGTTAIYNFDYYKTTDWMSDELINALTNWENKVEMYYSIIPDNYGTVLANLKIALDELLILQYGEHTEDGTIVIKGLSDLQAEFLALEGVEKARIEQGLPFADIVAQLAAKQLEINAKNAEITVKNEQIRLLRLRLTNINDELAFDNTDNFSAEQLVELSAYIFENTYQNENIIQTDSMTPTQIQDQGQILYDQAQDVLAKLSQPRYEFDVNSTNFIFLKEFETFASDLELGKKVWIELAEDRVIQTVLLEVSLNYDKPDEFSMKFSNRLRLDGSDFIFADLFGQVVKTGASLSFGKLNWENWENDYKDDVSTFITSALDASRNAVVNATNQEILINQNGLRGRKVIDSESDPMTYEDEQVWLTSSVLAFTEDNWQTASAALGKITTPAGPKYGLIADVIVGQMIAGNTLQITNAAGPNGDIVNFVLDNNGARLTNADFTIDSTTVQNLIKLNVTEGIYIQRKSDGVKTFSITPDGNLKIIGRIEATSGKIGSWEIDGYGLTQEVYSSTGYVENYIQVRPDGPGGSYRTYVKLGDLTLEPGKMDFAGTIYADKIDGQLTRDQIVDIVAEQVKAGSMALGTTNAGSGTGSGFLSWQNGKMKILETGTGAIEISATSTIYLRSGLSVVSVSPGGVTISGNGTVGIGIQGSEIFYCQRESKFGRIARFDSAAQFNSDILVGSLYGQSGTLTTGGYQLTFTNGILTGAVAV